jgi:hypothetical protein
VQVFVFKNVDNVLHVHVEPYLGAGEVPSFA